MTTPTATGAETIIHFTRHLAEPGRCGPPPPDPRGSEITGCKKPKGAREEAGQPADYRRRAVCEHAFAHLKNWRVLTRLRLDVKWATRLVRALMVLNWYKIAH